MANVKRGKRQASGMQWHHPQEGHAGVGESTCSFFHSDTEYQQLLEENPASCWLPYSAMFSGVHKY